MTDEELEQAKVIMDILKYDIKMDRYGTKRYRQYGLLHRDDGPAVERIDGNKEWWLNGKFVKMRGED
jgi:hypothetical protein